MANEYKIASFNAWNLSFNASVDKLAYIADIIKNGDFDIVGVQEVFTEGNTWGGASVESDINKRFLKYNLPGWECRYCKPSKENSRTADVRGEGFFLIWKTSSFKLAEYKEINNPEVRILDRFSPYIERVNTNDNGVNIITRQSKPSTISSPYIDEDGNEKMPDDPYKNNYDHFSYDMDRFKSNDVQVEVRRIDMDECIEEEPKKYETKELEYRKIVSDHVPVVMTITF